MKRKLEQRRDPGRRVSRRMVLRGLGGAALALPFLDGFRAEPADASDGTEPFAIFFRQACGVASEQSTSEIGAEPERFWPRELGPLTAANVQDRAVDELTEHLSRLLVVRNVNMSSGTGFDFGDGHAAGALQGLTARGPVVEGAGGDSEANGESIDHRIGRELNPDGRDSLFLYSGPDGGWLGGACISYRGPGERRAAIRDPWSAYQTITGNSAGVPPDEAARIERRQKSVNDLVRDQMTQLMSSPRLSASDLQKLQLHFDAIRDVEVALACRLSDDEAALVQTGTSLYDSNDGDDLIATTKLHMDVAALAVACGYTRSVSIQFGNGNDGSTLFRDPDTGATMENYHYISHRRTSHDSSGAIIPGSDVLHHKIDRYFAQMFKYLVDRLSAYQFPSGETLLDHGVAVWHNDNGNGPGHSRSNVPWILAGSAGGFLRQGECVEAAGSNATHNKVLNTIGSAVGVRNASGDALDDFGDPSFEKGLVAAMLA